MRVTVHLSSWYDYEPVPNDFDKSTDEFKAALSSGLVKAASKGGHVIRVTRATDNHVTLHIPESEIAQRLLYHSLAQNGSRVVSRKEAAADYVAICALPNFGLPVHVTKVEVHEDGPPDIAWYKGFLEPYRKGIHARTGEPIVPDRMLEPMLKAYSEPATAQDHVAHMHAKLNVQPKVTP